MTLHVARLPLSLDPLIAEAKQRMRRRRLLTSAIALALAAAAVGGAEFSSRSSAGSALRTNLTLTATSEFGARTVYQLTCHPAGGNLPHVAQACAAIAAHPTLITKPKPFVCWGFGFAITIVGRMNGQAVNTRMATCWTTQVALIRKLHLPVPKAPRRTLPPRVIVPGAWRSP